MSFYFVFLLLSLSSIVVPSADAFTITGSKALFRYRNGNNKHIMKNKLSSLLVLLNNNNSKNKKEKEEENNEKSSSLTKLLATHGGATTKEEEKEEVISKKTNSKKNTPVTSIRRPFVFAALATVVVAVAAVVIRTNSNPASALLLSRRHIFLASALVFSVTTITTLSSDSIGTKENNLLKSLWIGCIRCTVQLNLLGGIVLRGLFLCKNPFVVLLWLLGVGILAGQQTISQLSSSFKYRGLYGHLVSSILLSVFSVLGVAVSTKMIPNLNLRHSSILVPVAGMLFGNGISAVTLASQSLLESMGRDNNSGSCTAPSSLELRWSLGANTKEAIRPLLHKARWNALTPTLNALCTTGIVAIPGMMTGQLLAGNVPQQAAMYQTIIWFLITSTCCINVQLITHFITNAILDFKNDRMKKITKTKRKKGTTTTTTTPTNDDDIAVVHHQPILQPLLNKERTENDVSNNINNNNNVDDTTPVLLSIQNLKIPIVSTAMNNNNNPQQQHSSSSSTTTTMTKSKILQVSMNVHRGNRIGITGPSGSGKTQLLKALIGLAATATTVPEGESNNNTILKLFDDNDNNNNYQSPGSKELSWSQWRRRICYVSQDRPVLEGSPNDFFHELLTYRSVISSSSSPSSDTRGEEAEVVLRDILAKWNLVVVTNNNNNDKSSVLDRPWSTLSGGESQRILLAIVMTTIIISKKNNTILVLDEAISGLDKETQILVESMLQEYLQNCQLGAILMVTHSDEQLQRFCSHQFKL